MVSQTQAHVPLGQTRLGGISEIYYWRHISDNRRETDLKNWKKSIIRPSQTQAEAGRQDQGAFETGVTNPQTSSDVSTQLLISLTCFKKNFYYQVIVALGGNWWSINKTVDTLINRYIIEFGESWLKPNSRGIPLQVNVLRFMSEDKREPIPSLFWPISQSMSWPNNKFFVFDLIEGVFIHLLNNWNCFWCLNVQLLLFFRRNVDQSTKTSSLTVRHLIFSQLLLLLQLKYLLTVGLL